MILGLFNDENIDKHTHTHTYIYQYLNFKNISKILVKYR